MKKYESKEFISALAKKTNGKDIPSCPYCGGQKFTSTDKMATILIGDDIQKINLGPSIPAGMVICEKCGHMEFFALGILGLLNDNQGEKENGK